MSNEERSGPTKRVYIRAEFLTDIMQVFVVLRVFLFPLKVNIETYLLSNNLILHNFSRYVLEGRIEGNQREKLNSTRYIALFISVYIIGAVPCALGDGK